MPAPSQRSWMSSLRCLFLPSKASRSSQKFLTPPKLLIPKQNVVQKNQTIIAIPIALYRPEIGPPARNGEKMAKKWILAPPGKRGKMAQKVGKLAQKWAKNGHFPIFRPVFTLLNPFFAIFSSFRARPIWGLYRAIGIARQ